MQQLQVKSTAFQHYIQFVKLFISYLHFHFENKQETLFFSEKFSWPGGPVAPHFNWPKTKIYWPGPVGPLLKKSPVTFTAGNCPEVSHPAPCNTVLLCLLSRLNVLLNQDAIVNLSSSHSGFTTPCHTEENACKQVKHLIQSKICAAYDNYLNDLLGLAA